MKKKSILLISFIFIIIHLLADYYFQSISGTFGERRSSRDNEWINMNPASAPNGRYYFDMAADFIEHKVVLFGGLGQVGGDYCSLDDTWIYDPSSNIWENPAPAVHPPRRYGHTMSYSSVDSVIVLFGGVDPYDEPVVFNDIWFYHINSNTWEEVNITSPIPARGFQSMTFDSENNRIIIFGGYNYLTQQWFNDTWTYTIGDSVCTNQNPTISPGYRNGAKMIYNDVGNVSILFGGWSPPNQLGDTWVYDLNNNSWTQMYPSPSPSPRMSFGMTYDKINNEMILFGGGRLPPLFDDTWKYKLENNDWTNLFPSSSPSPRHRMPIAFVDSVVVLFGGYSTSGELNDTWLYTVPSPDIEVNPDSLLFITYEIATDYFTILNTGTSNLNITDIAYSSSWIISIEPASFSVLPNDSTVVEVTVNGAGIPSGEYVDSLIIHSNDPDEPELCLSITLQIPTGVDNNLEGFQEEQYLLQNCPNPFNPSTTISFETTNLHENARIEIYNIKGQKIKTFFTFPSGSCLIGTREVVWDGTDENNQPVSSGIYFYKLKVDGKSVAMKKCLLLK